jgi:hypothetical protein
MVPSVRLLCSHHVSLCAKSVLRALGFLCCLRAGTGWLNPGAGRGEAGSGPCYTCRSRSAVHGRTAAMT